MVHINSSGCRWRHCKSRDSGFDSYGSQFVLKSSSQNIKINVPGKVVQVLKSLVAWWVVSDTTSASNPARHHMTEVRHEGVFMASSAVLN